MGVRIGVINGSKKVDLPRTTAEYLPLRDVRLWEVKDTVFVCKLRPRRSVRLRKQSSYGKLKNTVFVSY